MSKVIPLFCVVFLVLIGSAALAQSLDTSTNFGPAYLYDADTGNSKIGALMTMRINEPEAINALKNDSKFTSKALGTLASHGRIAVVVEDTDPLSLGLGVGLELSETPTKSLNVGVYWSRARLKPTGYYLTWSAVMTTIG